MSQCDKFITFILLDRNKTTQKLENISRIREADFWIKWPPIKHGGLRQFSHSQGFPGISKPYQSPMGKLLVVVIFNIFEYSRIGTV